MEIHRIVMTVHVQEGTSFLHLYSLWHRNTPSIMDIHKPTEHVQGISTLLKNKEKLL